MEKVYTQVCVEWAMNHFNHKQSRASLCMPYNENNGKAVSGNLYQRFDEGLGINPPRLLYRPSVTPAMQNYSIQMKGVEIGNCLFTN